MNVSTRITEFYAHIMQVQHQLSKRNLQEAYQASKKAHICIAVSVVLGIVVYCVIALLLAVFLIILTVIAASVAQGLPSCNNA